MPEDTSLNSLLQLGTHWLNSREEKDQWSFVWQSIFKNSNLISKNEREKLVNTALAWLKVSQNKNDWPFIWEDLLKIKTLPRDIKGEILNLGLKWLEGKESHESWSFVFETCLRNHTITQDLLTKGIHWVFLNEKRKDTPGIAFEIANYYEMIIPSKKYGIHEWIRNWVYQSDPKNKGWSYGWAAYWKIMPTVESVDLALKWIEFNPEYTQGRWIIRTLFETGRTDVVNRIAKWQEKHLDHPISQTIKEYL